ncbi:MAG: aldolase/citrate lyase family protein [Proteobacteria bacterium]|nr:aldolase/citrate lyase family protein [Pseudomonadota bacterium]
MQLGTWITAPHPTYVELISSQNFDWICVDMEHSPVSRLDLQTAVSIIQGKGKRAFVRVPLNTHLEIKYPLDSGVDGIIIPMVNSAAEAKQAVENCFYAPKGKRGVGLSRAQGFGFGFEDHLKKNLKDLTVIVQIEHVDAVREIDQILAIDGVSGVFLGPYDLSASMGIPGQFEHPDMVAAIKRVSDQTIKTGKILGAHVIAPDHTVVKQFEAKGYNFIAFSLDTLFLGQKIKNELTALGRGANS